jgi:hypothetical protein
MREADPSMSPSNYTKNERSYTCSLRLSKNERGIHAHFKDDRNYIFTSYTKPYLSPELQTLICSTIFFENSRVDVTEKLA